MCSVFFRDLESVAALRQPMAAFESYLKQIRDDLLKSWQVTGEYKNQLRITLSHSLKFSSWQSLKNERLGDEKIAVLVTQWLHGIRPAA